MQCHICKKKPATVHFKQVYKGQVQELYACEDCAAKKGLDVPASMSVPDLLFGVAPSESAKLKPEDKRCRSCGVRRSDLQKTSRFGCPDCYETFAEELSPMLSGMHKGDRHTGKVPADRRASVEGVALQKALEDAVAAQNFEQAAVLRDRIRALKLAPPRPEP